MSPIIAKIAAIKAHTAELKKQTENNKNLMSKMRKQFETDKLKEKTIKEGSNKKPEIKNVTSVVEKPKVSKVPPKNATTAKSEQLAAKDQAPKKDLNDKSTKGEIDLDSVKEVNSPQQP